MNTVAVIVPSRDMVHADFAFALANLTVWSTLSDIRLIFINPKCSVVKGRNEGVRLALDTDATHFLFIDSDQTFPHWALVDLLNHKKRIIGVASTNRIKPVNWTARVNGQPIVIGADWWKDPIYVDTNGFSFMLIEREVFDPALFPWFRCGYDAEGKFFSEDEYFCKTAKDRGNPILVDPILSHKIGHLGTKTYTHEDIEP